MRRVGASKRPRETMSSSVRSALESKGLLEAYRARPAYQRNDYLGWINSAKREDTKKKRLHQMLRELAGGTKYMNMAYRPKTGAANGTRRS
jgi:uncharacterized protein YdeI (YjbR/CyaY-like superfamily)